MNKINFKIIFRSIRKQKVSNAMSILALTVGLSSFMLIFFYIRYEKGFDRTWYDTDRIYRVNLNKTLSDGSVSKTANNYQGLGWVMADEIPGVEYSTNLLQDKVMAYTHENCIPEAHFYWSDKSFFNIFNQPFLAGDPQNPFPTVQSMVISESTAKQLFGNEAPLGKHFNLNEGWEFIVSGVFADFPENSHLKIDILGTFDELLYYMNHFNNATSSLILDPLVRSSMPDPLQSWLWNNPTAYTYAKLKKGVSKEDIISGFNNIYKKYTASLLASGQKSEFIMQPISSIHTGENLENELSAKIDSQTISALRIVAILTLLMSWVIFINFQITQSTERAKEIGLKKVVGARSSGLSIQIVLQSVLINVIGMILASGIFFILRKSMSNYVGLKELIPVDPESLFWFILIFIFGSIISGLYPALIMTSKKAQLLLSKHFIQKNDNFGIRRALIIFQFAAAIGLLIATIIIVQQVSFMKNKDIGLSINQTVYSYTPMSAIKKAGSEERMKSFKEEVKRLAVVKNVTLSSSIPGKKINFQSNQVFPVNSPEKAGPAYGLLTIDENFKQVYSPRVLSGRLFSEEDIQGGNLLVINREACNQLGYESPEAAIGQFINVSVNDYINIDNIAYQICGVVDNFHQESPRKLIEPLLIINDLRWKYDVGFISVVFNRQAGSSIMNALKEIWKRFYPTDPFGFHYTSDAYQLQMNADKKLAGMFSLYTVLSVLLAILGLLGLSSNAIRKRVKEIGIRKVNGAKISEILMLLNKDFMKWVVIAFIIATPVAYYAMNIWLENFAYKTEISLWIFILTGSLALGIVLLTVSWQCWHAASKNPVEALKYE